MSIPCSIAMRLLYIPAFTPFIRGEPIAIHWAQFQTPCYFARPGIKNRDPLYLRTLDQRDKHLYNLYPILN